MFVCVCVSGLEIEGIFRRSANVTLVKEVQLKYNSGKWHIVIRCIKVKSLSMVTERAHVDWTKRQNTQVSDVGQTVVSVFVQCSF